MSDFSLSIPKLIAFEGSIFTNDPADHGGATKFGLTLSFLQGDVDKGYSEDELRDMTLTEAEAIYKKYWWDKYEIGSINNQLLADKVFESVTNLGPNHAIRLVQKAINDTGTPIHIDGVLGPQTINAMNTTKAPAILAALKVNLVSYYQGIVAHDPSQSKFLDGWLNRANG